MNQTRITIDGRTYDSVEAMPPDVRRLYDRLMGKSGSILEDKNANRIPDIAEGRTELAPGIAIEKHVVVNRQTYGSPDEMPPDVRAFFDAAMKQTSGDGGIKVVQKPPKISFSVSSTTASHQPPVPIPSPIQPSWAESSLRTLLTIAGLVIGGLATWALLTR